MTSPHRQPLRIAVVCEFPSLLGGERSMLAIEPALRAHGCELIWLAPDGGPLGVELRRRGSLFFHFSIRDDQGRLLPDEAARQSLAHVLTATPVDVIHGNSLAMARWLGRSAVRLAVPTTGHIRDIVGLSRSAVADVNRNRGLIAVSRATRDFHVAQGVVADLIRVVHNGIDIREFNHPLTDSLGRSSHNIRDELRLPPDTFLVATIGQIGLRKGQTVFAEAAVLIHQQTSAETDRPIHFLLIGERHSDKEESRRFDEQITSIVARGRIADHFHRLGYRDDVPALLSQIDVVVHPARQEPLGRVLLEAAAAGRAIIATDVGGTREILTDEVSALLVPPDNPPEIAEQMLRLWKEDELRKRLGTNARDAIAKRFTIENCAAGCLDVWHSTLQ